MGSTLFYCYSQTPAFTDAYRRLTRAPGPAPSARGGAARAAAAHARGEAPARAGAPGRRGAITMVCLLSSHTGGATIIVFPIQALRFRGRAGHISNSRPARQRGSQDGTHPESDRTEGEHTRARQQRGPHPRTGNFTLEAGSAACGRARVHRASTGARFDGRAPVPARRTCDQRRPQPPAGARSWGAASRASACGAPARCAPGLLHRHFNYWASGRAAPAWRARGAPQGPIPHTPDAIWGAAAGGPRPLAGAAGRVPQQSPAPAGGADQNSGRGAPGSVISGSARGCGAGRSVITGRSLLLACRGGGPCRQAQRAAARYHAAASWRGDAGAACSGSPAPWPCAPAHACIARALTVPPLQQLEQPSGAQARPERPGTPGGCLAGARTAASRQAAAGGGRAAGRGRTPANTSGRQSRSWQGNLAFLKCSTQPLQPCTLA